MPEPENTMKTSQFCAYSLMYLSNQCPSCNVLSGIIFVVLRPLDGAMSNVHIILKLCNKENGTRITIIGINMNNCKNNNMKVTINYLPLILTIYRLS